MRQTYRNPAVEFAAALVIAYFSLAFVNCGAWAQNPFEDPADTSSAGNLGPFGEPMTGFGIGASGPAPVAQGTVPETDPDPVVRLLRASPPKSPQQWADAFTWMSRIKRWDEVRRLLDELSGANWSEENKAALARAGGSAIWLRLRADEAELTSAQSDLVRSILLAPGKLARDTSRIDKWIDQLASPHPGETKLAQFRLQDGSTVAIQGLIDRLLDGGQTVDPALLAATIVMFGRDGEDALQAACVVRDPERAGRVFLALAELPSGAFTAELGAAIAGRSLSLEVQTALAEILLAKHGRIPEPPAVHAYLQKKFDAALADYQIQRVNKAVMQTFVWRPTPDGKSIQLAEAPPAQRALERLGQLSVHRANLKNASRDDLVATGAALLQRAYQVNPTLEAADVQSHLLSPLDAELSADADYWQQVFEQADTWQMHGAAIRSLQLLTQHAVAADYLAPLDFLSQQLGDSRPVIRYSALRAIAQLNPQQPFAGAGKAVEIALEMTELGNGPHALVVGLQADLRNAAGQLLQQSGATVTEANSSKAALLALSGSAPIELILVVDRVSDLSLFELLQRLRNTKNGHSLPIAVLTERLYAHERRLAGEMSGVVLSVLSADQAHMDRVVRSMLETLDTNALSAADRGELAQVGGDFLATISSDRDLYAFYPISDWRTRLIHAQGGLALSSQMTVISAVGSAEGQRKLSLMAATAHYSEQERIDAAMAFGKSVRRFGMLMRPNDVLRNYDLYNELGPSDPAAAKALGLILDVTEAHAGNVSWPEGL